MHVSELHSPAVAASMVLCRQVYAAITGDTTFASCCVDLLLAMQLCAAGPVWQHLQQDSISPAERLETGASLCGLVCWSLALLASLWGCPGPDAPTNDFNYGSVIKQLLGHPKVRRL